MRSVALLLVAVLAATGCGGRDAAPETPELDRPAGVTAAEEDAFLAQFFGDKRGTAEATQREPQVLQLAYAVCSDLASGTNFNDVIGKAVEYGADPLDFGVFVSNVVQTLCPEHAPTATPTPAVSQ